MRRVAIVLPGVFWVLLAGCGEPDGPGYTSTPNRPTSITPSPTPAPTPAPVAPAPAPPTPAPPPPPPAPKPVVKVTNPAPGTAPDITPVLLVHTSFVTLTGIATPDVTAVTWHNSMTGQSGTAIGTVSWTADLPLTLGSNLIEFTGTTPSSQARYWLMVEFNPGPMVRILSYTFTSVNWPIVSVTVKGIASSPRGIVEVTWRNSSLETGWAEGTTSWTADVPVQSPSTGITVTARDAGWFTAVDSITVTYSLDPPTLGGDDPNWYIP